MRLFPWVTLFAIMLTGCFSVAILATPMQSPSIADSSPATNPHHADPQQQARRLARKLQLEPAQTAQIETILQNRSQQIEQLRADSSMDESSRRQQLRAIRQQGEQALRAILSDSQLQLYRQLRQQARQRHLEHKAPASSSSA